VLMDRAIFELNASVEATSLYILLCALAEQGGPITLHDARSRWNGTEEDLFTAAEELIRCRVLDAADPLREDTPLQLTSQEQWRRS
jgi:hypothetical protein